MARGWQELVPASFNALSKYDISLAVMPRMKDPILWRWDSLESASIQCSLSDEGARKVKGARFSSLIGDSGMTRYLGFVRTRCPYDESK